MRGKIALGRVCLQDLYASCLPPNYAILCIAPSSYLLFCTFSSYGEDSMIYIRTPLILPFLRIRKDALAIL
jgi:hypothetical protein